MGKVVCGWWLGGGDAFLWGWKMSFFRKLCGGFVYFVYICIRLL